MVILLMRTPDGTAELIVGLTREQWRGLRDGNVLEMTLGPHAEQITKVSMLYRPTQRELMEDLSPLMGPHTQVSVTDVVANELAEEKDAAGESNSNG